MQVNTKKQKSEKPPKELRLICSYHPYPKLQTGLIFRNFRSTTLRGKWYSSNKCWLDNSSGASILDASPTEASKSSSIFRLTEYNM